MGERCYRTQGGGGLVTRTKGVSPKLIGPALAPVMLTVQTLIETGTLDRKSLGAAVVSLLALIAAYLAPPGRVEQT